MRASDAPGCGRRSRRCSALACLLALALLRAPAAAAAPPLCEDDRWTEASVDALENGTARPLVQCWRTPACVRHSYLTPARCAARPLDADWAPADDAPGTAAARFAAAAGGATSLAALADRFFANRTVMFTGDSVTEGLWDFLLCQAAREGLAPVKVPEHGSPPVDVDAGLAARLETFLARRDAAPWAVNTHVGERPRHVALLPRSGTILVRKPTYHYEATDLAAQLSLADVLIVNYGLHSAFGSAEEQAAYGADMAAAFAQAQQAAAQPGRAVVFRETAAQHFQGTGGFVSWAQAHPSNVSVACECTAMTAETERSNAVAGRNGAVAAAHASAAAPDVRVQPFYALTADRHFGHEAAFCAFVQRGAATGCCDCTHMCYAPALARALVAGMHAALVGSNADAWLRDGGAPPQAQPPA